MMPATITFFFIGGFLSNIFVNIRYGLLLYPLFGFITAIFFNQVYDYLKTRLSFLVSIKILPLVFSLILIILPQLYSLWKIKPHYFNYENFLLPKEYVVTDSWGYGIYEAAQYLNSQPNAKNLVAWSDRDGLCQFFIGRCITARKINLDYTQLDYFVFTRRGMIHKPFSVVGKNIPTGLTRKNYTSTNSQLFKNPAWQLSIGGRTKNFIKIIKVKK